MLPVQSDPVDEDPAMVAGSGTHGLLVFGADSLENGHVAYNLPGLTADFEALALDAFVHEGYISATCAPVWAAYLTARGGGFDSDQSVGAARVFMRAAHD